MYLLCLSSYYTENISKATSFILLHKLFHLSRKPVNLEENLGPIIAVVIFACEYGVWSSIRTCRKFPRQTWRGVMLREFDTSLRPSLISRLKLLQETQNFRTCVTICKGNRLERKTILFIGEYVPVILQPAGNLERSTLTPGPFNSVVRDEKWGVTRAAFHNK